jgi:hypothetical protein
MRIKEGVKLDGIQTTITKTFHIVEFFLNSHGQEMWITSGLEGEHMKDSKHYTGEAIDVRIWDLINKQDCVTKIREALGTDYDVVLESSHIHIEYDPK